MKIDFHADAPFDIKEDIDKIYYGYKYITNNYGALLLIGLILFIIYYFNSSSNKKTESSIKMTDEERRIANEKRMQAIRRKQVGDTLEMRVKSRKQDPLLRDVKQSFVY